MKTCNKCAAELDPSHFTRDKSKSDGLRTICRDCDKRSRSSRDREELNQWYRDYRKRRPDIFKALRKKSYQKNREKILARGRAWRQSNPEKVRAYRKRNNILNRDSIRSYQLRYKYGISVNALNQMKVSQDNRCAICKCEFSVEPMVDHDHATGAVRGLLCASCNLGLGKFKDDPAVLRLAADYLDSLVRLPINL